MKNQTLKQLSDIDNELLTMTDNELDLFVYGNKTLSMNYIKCLQKSLLTSKQRLTKIKKAHSIKQLRLN